MRPAKPTPPNHLHPQTFLYSSSHLITFTCKHLPFTFTYPFYMDFISKKTEEKKTKLFDSNEKSIIL